MVSKIGEKGRKLFFYHWKGGAFLDICQEVAYNILTITWILNEWERLL